MDNRERAEHPPAARPMKRLSRATLASQLCDEIRLAILQGVFALGAQLNELDLAQTFGVSRGPVREALQRLIQEGLLRSEPHRGVFVPELTDDDLVDIYFLRASLELAAMERIMALPDRSALQQSLLETAKRMREALQRQDWPLMAELDMDFHRQIVTAAKSRRLSRAYATVQAESKLCLHNLLGGYRGNKELVDEHQLLAELVGKDDAAACMAELRRHFGDPIKTLHKARASRDRRTAA